MSELRTNKIYPRDGLPAGASGGGIIQIVQGSTQTEVNTNSTTYVDTTLSATITPTSLSNKIFVMVSQQFHMDNNSAGSWGAGMRVLRDSTTIYEPATDVNGPFGDSYLSFGTSTDIDVYLRWHIEVLDNPGTTSAITYKVQARPYTVAPSGMALTLNSNRTQGDAISYITLMEVSG